GDRRSRCPAALLVRRSYQTMNRGNEFARTHRLPHDVRDRLQAALSPYRNRESAFALAVFLGRFWSAPGRLATAFSIDRRELAEYAALDLTEARVRGAIR